jgi:hypothetical protein
MTNGPIEDGREYRALIEITYTGGTLPADTRDALTSATSAAMGDVPMEFTVSADPYSVLTISARLRGTDPLAAIARLDAALDRSLMATDLFEEFDVSGRVLSVAPWASRTYLRE